MAGETPKARAAAVSLRSRTRQRRSEVTLPAWPGPGKPHPREQRRRGAGDLPEGMKEGNDIMSGSLNKVQLIGNLGADPESRTMPNGGLVVTLSIATNESWRDPASGERRTRTEWHRVVIFNEGLGKAAGQYLAKGAKVYVEGTLRTRKWRDSDGHDRYSTEIHLTPYNGTLTFLDAPGTAEGAPGGHDPDATAGY